MRRVGRPGIAALLITISCGLSAPAQAAAQRDSVTVLPGARYRATSEVHARLLGDRYRSLWTTPIRVPVLDLGAFAGGLTPVEEGGHKQTRSLRFRGADGREYNFRSVDKDVTQGLPEFARETAADWVLQDLTSAQLPAAAVVATALLDAADVLNPGPRLFVLPDDAALGGFRAEFAGMLGTLEVHANEGEDGQPLFAGSPRVVGTDRMLEHLEESPRNRADERAFLRARLMDGLLGDFDRHADQWRWARFDREGIHWWVPVPEDRDYAFVDYDGLIPALARKTVARRLIRFEDHFPGALALMDNSLALNRRLLAGLPWLEWAAAVARLQEALPDSVIEDAVLRMPAAHVELYGAELVRTLKARRDRLGELARDLYRTLAVSVEVHATDQADLASVVREPDGSVRVQLVALEGDADVEPGTSPAAYYARTLHPAETEEVRIHLRGGDDRALVSGAGSSLVVRVIGGSGDDLLEDRSAGPTAFYDSRGENRIVEGPRTRVSRREHQEPEDDDGLIPSVRRDWGRRGSIFAPYAGWRSHAELVVGGGPTWTRFGFRHHPYRWSAEARALYAPLHGRAAVEATADFRRASSPLAIYLRGRATQMEATLVSGFGNDAPYSPTREARVWHERLVVEGGARFPVLATGRVSLAALVRHTSSSVPEDSPLVGRAPYGADPVGQIGARAGFSWVTAASEPFGAGATVELGGDLFPALWDLTRPYSRVQAVGTLGREIPGLAGVVLAGRAGGTAVAGDSPFFDAAFLGGWNSLRGYRYQRFAGDRALFGGADLHVPLSRAELFVRGDLGVSLFADAGRVFDHQRSPGGWHAAAGGSLWFSTPLGAVVASFARGEESRYYLRLEPRR